ncbi:MAG: hypothetical protein ACPG4T_19450 [Nannocystaceae bacterium]
MGLFGRKQTKPQNLGWGRKTVAIVYTGEASERLLAAVDATAEVFGTPIGSRLADELVAGRFRGPRSAVNSLRREGIAGIPAIPAIAAWVRSTIGKISNDNGGYGVREGMLTLGDLRRMVLSQSMGAEIEVREGLRVFAGFLDGEVEEAARTLITTPSGRAARGAISYLRDSRGDLQASVQALEAYLDNHPGETGDGDFDYSRNDAMYAMQDIASRLRTTASKSEPEPSSPQAPHIADIELPSDDDDDDDLDDDDLDDDDELPSQGNHATCNRRREAAHSPDLDAIRTQVAELLRTAARDDPDPNVRIAALDNLSLNPGNTELRLELARTCLAAEEPEVRIAAIRLLGRLAQT